MMERTKLRRLLFIMDAIYFGILSVAWFPAIFSVMLAAGGTSLRVHIQVYSLMTFPFVLLFSILIPWFFYALRMPRTTVVLLLLPFVNAVLILGFVVIPEMVA